MNQETHTRAEQLIAQERVEGISQAEPEWLSAHLQESARCSELERQTGQAVRSMRTAAIPPPGGLTSRREFPGRLRSQGLRAPGPRQPLTGVTFCLSLATPPT